MRQRLIASPFACIDVDALRRDSTERKNFIAAACDGGFLHLVNHTISAGALKRLEQRSCEFFALPNEEKMRYYIGVAPNHRGYVPRSEQGAYLDEQERLYESFDVGLGLGPFDAANPLAGPNLWPSVRGFRTAFLRHLNHMQRITATLVAVLESEFGLKPGTIARHMTEPMSQLRSISYGSPKEQQSSIGMGAHTDYECFTILHTTCPALQVMSIEGEWIDVPHVEGALHFNVGDMLHQWSGGSLMSTLHRVTEITEPRQAFPFFAGLNYGTVVRPFAGNDTSSIHAGDHMITQLKRDFPYLRSGDEPVIVLSEFEDRTHVHA